MIGSWKAMACSRSGCNGAHILLDPDISLSRVLAKSGKFFQVRLSRSPSPGGLRRSFVTIPFVNKVLASADEAVAQIPDGARIMMGGFGLCGIPEAVLAAPHARGTIGLTVVSQPVGVHA